MRSHGVPIEEWANEFAFVILFNPALREEAQGNQVLIGRFHFFILTDIYTRKNKKDEE